MKSFSPKNSKYTNTTQHSRREFLTKTALFAGGILSFGWPTGRSNSGFAAQSRQTLQRGGSTVRYLLELNGAIVGPLNTMESGFVSGEIITYQDGDDLFMRKRLGRLKYEDIVLTCGANLSLPFYQWLAGTLDGLNPRKNGAIVAVNPNGQIIDRREFQNTLVKEVQFPALDGASHEPAYFKVTLTPERIRYQLPNSRQDVPSPQANQAPLRTSKFRLGIQGLEQACAFVRRIEPLVVKQEIINYQDGRDARQSSVAGGRLEVGNLVITLPQHQAGPFTEWFSSFVLQGQNSENTKQGLLEFLAPDAQTVLAAVTLHNLGIFRMGPVTRGGAYQVQVEMYCERVQLTQFPGSGANPTQRQAPRLRQRKLRKPTTGKQLPPLQQRK